MVVDGTGRLRPRRCSCVRPCHRGRSPTPNHPGLASRPGAGRAVAPRGGSCGRFRCPDPPPRSTSCSPVPHRDPQGVRDGVGGVPPARAPSPGGVPDPVLPRLAARPPRGMSLGPVRGADPGQSAGEDFTTAEFRSRAAGLHGPLAKGLRRVGEGCPGMVGGMPEPCAPPSGSRRELALHKGVHCCLGACRPFARHLSGSGLRCRRRQSPPPDWRNPGSGGWWGRVERNGGPGSTRGRKG